jgi:hypothetical protein
VNRRLVATASLLAALVPALVGCGIPEDNEPRAIAPEDLPDQLIDPSGEGVTPPTNTAGESRLVYVVASGEDSEDDRLFGIPAVIEGTPDESAMIEYLLQTREETLVNFEESADVEALSNAIPPEVQLLGFEYGETEDGETIGIITLSEEFEEALGENYEYAVAQLVWTATELGTVQRVRFRVDDAFIQVPAGTQNEQRSIVGRDEYRDLQPEITSSTDTGPAAGE